MGLKLAGSSEVPFYEPRLCRPFFQFAGMWPDSQITQVMFVRNDLRYGHLLKDIIDILSRGHGEPDVFILRITLVTFS